MSRAAEVEVRIYDRRDDMPEAIVPLAPLLSRLQALRPDALTGRWRASLGTYGYGENVVRLEEAASAASADVDVDAAALFPAQHLPVRALRV